MKDRVLLELSLAMKERERALEELLTKPPKDFYRWLETEKVYLDSFLRQYLQWRAAEREATLADSQSS